MARSSPQTTSYSPTRPRPVTCSRPSDGGLLLTAAAKSDDISAPIVLSSASSWIGCVRWARHSYGVYCPALENSILPTLLFSVDVLDPKPKRSRRLPGGEFSRWLREYT